MRRGPARPESARPCPRLRGRSPTVDRTPRPWEHPAPNRPRPGPPLRCSRLSSGLPAALAGRRTAVCLHRPLGHPLALRAQRLPLLLAAFLPLLCGVRRGLLLGSAGQVRGELWMVGYLNRSTMGTSRPSNSCRRLCACAISSEWPPRSKKLSCTLTRSTPSTCCQMPARSRSSWLCGSATSRAGRPDDSVTASFCSAARSTLPLALSGICVDCDERSRHHVVGQLATQVAAQLGLGRAGRCKGRHVSDQPHVAARIPRVARLIVLSPVAIHPPGQHNRLPDAGRFAQHRLDLAQLHPEPANLDLVIGPAEKVDAAVGSPARQVACAVEAQPGSAGSPRRWGGFV